MPAKYSIIQFIPNPIANERINIGVITFDTTNVHVRFLKNWERVKRFASNDIQFLQDFAEKCEQAVSPNLLFSTMENFPRLDETQILAMAHGWKNSIQLTEPEAPRNQQKFCYLILHRNFSLSIFVSKKNTAIKWRQQR